MLTKNKKHSKAVFLTKKRFPTGWHGLNASSQKISMISWSIIGTITARGLAILNYFNFFLEIKKYIYLWIKFGIKQNFMTFP